MKYLNFKPLDAVASTATTLNSSPIDFSEAYRFSLQVVTGAGSTLTGSVQVQVSNDPIPVGYNMLPAPTHWSNLGSAVTLSAANTNYLVAAQDVSYRSMRIVLTGDSGNDVPVTVQVMAICI